MSSEPPRASLLRALFKMEPVAAAAEVLGGASEFVKGECGRAAGPAPTPREGAPAYAPSWPCRSLGRSGARSALPPFALRFSRVACPAAAGNA